MDEDDELYDSLTECYWCGLPTGGSHYCNEYCRAMDNRPTCDVCGDRIEEEIDEYPWWEMETDGLPVHFGCYGKLVAISS